MGRREKDVVRRGRILYWYSSAHANTGSPKVLISMVELLDHNRFQALYLASGDGPLVRALAARGVEVIYGSVDPVEARRPLRSIVQVLRQEQVLSKNKVDLLHVNELGWNLDIVIGAWLGRVPTIFHLHNPQSIHANNLHRFIGRRFLTVSRAQTDSILGFEYIRSRHQVLHNSVDSERFSSGKPIRAELGLRDEDVVVITVAQICFRKGIDIVLETANQLLPYHRDLFFLVVGPAGKGEEDFAQRMVVEASSGSLRNRVLFTGSRDDIPNLLASSDVFFLPTRAEPFGIAIVEAMAAGLPIVASRVGGIPEIIDMTDYARLVSVGDVSGFARALEEFIELGGRRRILGEAARKSIQCRFDRYTIGRELNDLYCELLGWPKEIR